MGVSKHYIQGTYEGVTLEAEDFWSSQIYTRDISHLVTQFDYWSLDLEIAKRKIIAKSLYVDYGMTSSMNLGILFAKGNKQEIEEDLQQFYFEDRKSYLLRDIVSFRFGIGYILH
jgi:hypothetical protein